MLKQSKGYCSSMAFLTVNLYFATSIDSKNLYPFNISKPNSVTSLRLLDPPGYCCDTVKRNWFFFTHLFK